MESDSEQPYMVKRVVNWDGLLVLYWTYINSQIHWTYPRNVPVGFPVLVVCEDVEIFTMGHDLLFWNKCWSGNRLQFDPSPCVRMTIINFLKTFLWWQFTILWSHWCSLFQTSVDSGHGFQSQVGSIITCNDPQSQLWIPRPGPGPNFTPWYGGATARVTTQCHFSEHI